MNKQRTGIMFALSAFVAWGFLPVYWKQIQGVTPFEILCHRIVWACAFLFIIIVFQKRLSEVSDVVLAFGNMAKLCCSGLLIGTNWFLYIWAVNSDHILETSLGYYINPMVNVAIGFLLFRERFSRLKWAALLCATTGVGYSLIAYGKLPLFALSLAFCFAFYGYVHKKTAVAPIPCLLIETGVLFFPALGYLIYQQYCGSSLFGHQWAISLWLVGGGIVTSFPLLWFVMATKELNLSTIGIMQYIAPTIAFVLGVFVYQEPFDLHTVITFFLIWVGVFIFCTDSIMRFRNSSSK